MYLIILQIIRLRVQNLISRFAIIYITRSFLCFYATAPTISQIGTTRDFVDNDATTREQSSVRYDAADDRTDKSGAEFDRTDQSGVEFDRTDDPDDQSGAEVIGITTIILLITLNIMLFIILHLLRFVL